MGGSADSSKSSMSSSTCGRAGVVRIVARTVVHIVFLVVHVAKEKSIRVV